LRVFEPKSNVVTQYDSEVIRDDPIAPILYPLEDLLKKSYIRRLKIVLQSFPKIAEKKEEGDVWKMLDVLLSQILLDVMFEFFNFLGSVHVRAFGLFSCTFSYAVI